MRRKLVNFEVFQKISDGSLTKAEKELIQAEEVLAKAIGEEQLTLHCFDDSTVTYETLDKSYVHASYSLDKNNVIFENIQQLVIDESSAKQASQDLLRKMFDEVLSKNENAADAHFKEYIELPFVRRSFMEGESQVWVEPKGKSHKKGKPQPPWLSHKRAEAKKKNQRFVSTSEKQRAKRERETLKKRFGSGSHVHIRFKPQTKKKVSEWYGLTENVFSYLDYQEFGPAAASSDVNRDDKGNVLAVRIPNSKSRNEGKILSFNWKTLNTDLMILRSKMKNLAEDVNFCKAMADLRRCNALSDSKRLQEVLEAIVVRWPNVIYLAQTELSEAISKALDTIGETAYDDQVCAFMAEGILRTAAGAYDERVDKIMKLSGVKFETSEDKYMDFQKVAHKFYKFVDENSLLEMQVFVDLYNALVEVYKVAHEEGNEFLMGETTSYLKELKTVIDRDAEPTMELAGDVAAWLRNLVETNLESETWKVSNTPHMTVSGDHPQMAKNASKPYNPSSDFSGDWGDPLPVSDGKSYKGGLADEMRKSSWGNMANNDTWPALDNPYVPKAGEWTMKGEKGADKSGDSDWSRWQSSDTWPSLQNPYVPKAETPDSYKMNHGKEDDLVVEK
jgi:hypothetical protein